MEFISEFFLDILYFSVGFTALTQPVFGVWLMITATSAIFYAITFGDFYDIFEKWFISYTMIIIVIGAIKYYGKYILIKYGYIEEKKTKEELKKERYKDYTR